MTGTLGDVFGSLAIGIPAALQFRRWIMTTAAQADRDTIAKKSTTPNGNGKAATGKGTNGKSPTKANRRQSARTAGSNGKTRSAGQRRDSALRNGRNSLPEVPVWLATVMSVVGVGVAVGAGLYATRKQWLPTAHDWKDNFSAAFANDETDAQNFDQTRNAGTEAMRDHPGDDWDDVDDISDASFPASDPPSFNPGTA
jgi:hypothetical protein